MSKNTETFYVKSDPDYDDDWVVDYQKIKEGIKRFQENGRVATSFELEPGLIEDLTKEAREHGMTYSDLIRSCVVKGYMLQRQQWHKKTS